MRVLIVSECGKYGGTIAVNNLIKSLRERGIEVFRICASPSYINMIGWISSPRNVDAIFKRPNFKIILKTIQNLKHSYTKIKQYSKSLKITLFHTIFYAYNQAYFEEIIKEYKPDIIHIHGISLQFLPFYEHLFEKNIKFVATSHSILHKEPDVELFYDPKIEKDLVTKIIHHGILTVVSNDMKDFYAKTFNIPKNKIFVINNGVNIKKFCQPSIPKEILRERYKIPKDKIVFITVGSLTKLKNQIAVLKAISEMDSKMKKRIHYVLVGDGPEKDNLINFVKKKNLTSFVSFIGRVPHKKIWELYALSDFLIHTSTSEGLSLVFLEAMAMGLPIITFADLGGVRDIYNPQCFELISERSTKAIIDAIKRAIEKDWDRSKIREYANTFDWKNISNKYIKLYKSVMSNQKNRGIFDGIPKYNNDYS